MFRTTKKAYKNDRQYRCMSWCVLQVISTGLDWFSQTYATTTPDHLTLILYLIWQLWIQIQEKNYTPDFYV